MAIPARMVYGHLKQLIRSTGAFCYSPEKPFILASGKTSPYYFDMRLLSAHPEGLHLAARAILEQIPGQARSVGGPASGAIPLATAISLESRYMERPLQSFYVRESAKVHGTGRLIEGISESPYVLVDDVITTGSSVLRAAGAAGDGCAGIYTILFRGSVQDRSRLEDVAPFWCVFVQDDII